ncbi:hypothetical protein H4R19_007231, partial [Coemansia spiralis]
MSAGNVALAAQNSRLFKPFVSPDRSKSAGGVPNGPRRPGTLKRLLSVRKSAAGGGGSPVSPQKRKSPDSPPSDGNDSGEQECLPGINYNGMSKKLFKPFRPPRPIGAADSDGGDTAASDDRSDNGPRPLGRSLGMRRRVGMAKGPRYNPDAEDAVVLYRPPAHSEPDLVVPDLARSPSSASDASKSSGSGSGSGASGAVPTARQNKSLKTLLGI